MNNAAVWRGMKYPDSELVGLLYHFARPGRDVEADHPLGIDVGCGPGRHVRLLDELGYDALGIDLDPEMCSVARANGVRAEVADVQTYRPPRRPALVVCWGFMMLVQDGPELMASWQPDLIVADWRSLSNSCLRWPDNERLDSGAVRLRRKGHLLNGQEYFFHGLSNCVIPGYERVHWQRVSRETERECNEWFQTVHRRTVS